MRETIFKMCKEIVALGMLPPMMVDEAKQVVSGEDGWTMIFIWWAIRGRPLARPLA